METHYFSAKAGLSIVWQLAGDGVPFKFMSRARRPMQFSGIAGDVAIVLTHADAETYRGALDECSVAVA